MTRFNAKNKCPECGSTKTTIVLDENYHKIEVRLCNEGCSKHKEVIEDYGYSEKLKIKLAKKPNSKLHLSKI